MTDSRRIPQFAPVPHKTISHGWTVARQRGFIEAMAATGSGGYDRAGQQVANAGSTSAVDPVARAFPPNPST